MGKALLLISGNAEDRSFAAAAAIASGLSLRMTSDPREGSQILATEEVHAVLADASTPVVYQQLEGAIQETLGLFSDRVNANAIHLISHLPLDEVKHIIQSPLFGAYIYRKYGSPEEAGTHYGRILKATQGERAFGLQQLFAAGTKIQTIKLKNSNQKQQAVEAVRNYLIAAKFQSRMSSLIANAVDELLMNAIFDAPVDDMGKTLLASTSRAAAFPLTGRQEVEMQIGFDGQYIAVSASDQFGSIDKQKLMSHISKIYTKDEYKVRSTVAGAGIGLATVFQSGGSFFFVSDSRVRTEVTVLFRRCESFREFKDQFRFLSTQFYF